MKRYYSPRRHYRPLGAKGRVSALKYLLMAAVVVVLYPFMWVHDFLTYKERAVKAATQYHNSNYYSQLKRVVSVERRGFQDYGVTFEVCHRGKCYDAFIECFGDEALDCRVGK